MAAVENQAAQNVAAAQQFFTAVSGAIERFVTSEAAGNNIVELCEHLLLLAPLLRGLRDYVRAVLRRHA